MNVQSAVPAWLQICWAIAGLAVAVGGALWIAFIFYPYIKWTKRIMLESLVLGQETAKILETLKREIDPMILDLRGVVKDVREMVHGFKDRHDLEKVAAALDQITKGGRLDETLEAIRQIPKRLERFGGGESASEVDVPKIDG